MALRLAGIILLAVGFTSSCSNDVDVKRAGLEAKSTACLDNQVYNEEAKACLAADGSDDKNQQNGQALNCDAANHLVADAAGKSCVCEDKYALDAKTGKCTANTGCVRVQSAGLDPNASMQGTPPACQCNTGYIPMTKELQASAATDSCVPTSTPKVQNYQALIMMAGQSNMEGNLDFPLTLGIFEDATAQDKSTMKDRIETRLNTWYQTYQEGYASYAYAPEVSTLEASALTAMAAKGEIEKLQAANSMARCTNDPITKPAVPLMYRNDPDNSDNCGSPFGLELKMGLDLAKVFFEPLTIVKIAEGGTTLNEDWTSPTAAQTRGSTQGYMFTRLASAISLLKTSGASIHPDCAKTDLKPCTWKAFVWFQGENDVFDTEAAKNYEANLKALISDVRTLFNDANFPVVVVQIGFWASTLSKEGTKIHAAQKSVAASDSHIRLVTTDDLSRYYHYDPAAQLIIGERVAQAIGDLYKTTP